MNDTKKIIIENIHVVCLRKILITTISLAIFVGISVYYFETEQVDDFVLNLAVQESDIYNDIELKYESKIILDSKCRQLNDLHFPIVEVYNLHQQKLVECINPKKQHIENKLKKIKHAFSDKPIYDKYEIDNHYYLRVVSPLISDDRKSKIGYFEGVYEIDDATLNQIKLNIFFTVGVSIFCILVIGGILYPIILKLNKSLIENNKALLQSNVQLMEVLGSAIAKRDSDTNIHNYRVTIYAINLGQKIGLDVEEIRNLILGSFLHDVGKIGISDSILLKPAGFTDEEFAIMKTHVQLGLDIIDKSPWLNNAKDVIQFHHEKYDGTGYMKGLRGEDIPINARIFAVVDVFDALTSKRPYKKAFTYEESIKILEEGKNKHFDGKLVEIFQAIVQPIFTRLSNATDKEIEKELHILVDQYFTL